MSKTNGDNPAKAFAAQFRDARHHPFYMIGDRAYKRAALLIHGFPGTPAEMRPLAHSLNRIGWTAQGILLPGFGADIESLPKRKNSEWVRAAETALVALQNDHRPTLIIGNSMGGALAIQAAARFKPDGLILINPFWQLDNRLWRLLPVLKYVFPQFKPFSMIKINFEDVETRKGIAGFIPGANLDDPDVRKAVKDFAIPTGMLDQLRGAGQMAGKAALLLTMPVLILQGSGDTLVNPATTQALVAKMTTAKVEYHEVSGEHNLLDPALPVWSTVESFALDFAERVRK
jgi:carboxylesterase